MAHKKNTTNLTELLLQCVTQPDPMLSMLEWLCTHLMEAEVDQQLGAEKSQRTDGRSGYRSGYRPRRLDTRMGTMYLMVPKVRQGGYIPFFVTERKRSEAMLVQVVQEAFVQGVSTRKMEKLAHRLGIENLSRSQVSEMTKGLNVSLQRYQEQHLEGLLSLHGLAGQGTSINKAWLSYETRGACLGAGTASQGGSRSGYDH